MEYSHRMLWFVASVNKTRVNSCAGAHSCVMCWIWHNEKDHGEHKMCVCVCVCVCVCLFVCLSDPVQCSHPNPF